MSNPMDWSAAELANALERLSASLHNTGGASMLDEATMTFASKSPAVAELHREFSEARHRHQRSHAPGASPMSGYSAKAWLHVATAARDLASVLRPLGDVRIARCKQQAGWGTCNLPLGDDGACRGSANHIPG